jgi:hypothetical protein
MNINEPESPLESWEKFLRAYVAKHRLKYEDVIKNAELVERLNIIWLRTRTALDGKGNPA